MRNPMTRISATKPPSEFIRKAFRHIGESSDRHQHEERLENHFPIGEMKNGEDETEHEN